MQGSVTSRDIRPAIAALSTIDSSLTREWRDRARTELIDPLVTDLRAAAPAGKLGAAAARSIRASSARIPAFRFGVGEFKPGLQPAFGLEWGADRDAHHLYIRRNRRKPGHHLVNRRVLRWARPRNEHGWWMRPRFLAEQPRLRDRAAAIMDDLIRARLG